MRIFLCILACAASLFASGDLSGRRAPGFSLPDVNLQQHDSQDYKGKILLVEIMQTNCTHCASFSSVLEEVAAKYRDRVAVLSVVNPPDNLASVKRFVSERKISTPILFDCGQVAASYLKAGPQNPDVKVPHLFIIDGQGMIRSDYGYGPLTKGIFEGRELFAELDRMLGKR